MKGVSLVGLAFLLFGCTDEGARTNEANATNAEIEKIREANPGIKEECLDKMRTGEIGAVVSDNETECFEMMPARKWSGLWNSGWEWTNFCSEPAKECPIRSEHGDVWLEFAERAYPKPEPTDGLYRIEFIGRRSVAPGRFGHLNQYDHLMVVDRLISLKKASEEKEK